MPDFNRVKPFRFWCQKVLPLVCDDSLSYYELLNKVVDYLNKTIKDVNSVIQLTEDFTEEQAQAYAEFTAGINQTVEELTSAFNTLHNFVDGYFENLDVQEEIDNKLDKMAVDGTLTNMVRPVAASMIPGLVSQWLEDNITPTTPAVDRTLSITGAAADAREVGYRLGWVGDSYSWTDNSQYYPLTGNIVANQNYARTARVKGNINEIIGIRAIAGTADAHCIALWKDNVYVGWFTYGIVSGVAGYYYFAVGSTDPVSYVEHDEYAISWFKNEDYPNYDWIFRRAKLAEDVTGLKEDLSELEDDVYNGKPSPKVNYLNPEDIEEGEQLKDDGTLSDNSSYNVSGFCEVDNSKAYAVVTGYRESNPSQRIAKTFYRMAFYSESKGFIPPAISGDGIREVALPNNAKYMRFSSTTNGVWAYAPMVEYVDNVSDISETFVDYDSQGERTPGINEINEEIVEIKADMSELQDDVDTIIPILNNDLIATLNSKGYKGGSAIGGEVGSQVTVTVNSNWRYTLFDVSGYSKIAVSTIIYGTTYYGVVFATDNDVIISKELYKGESAPETITDYWLDVPQHATRAYINKRSDISGDKATAKVSINTKMMTDYIDQAKCEFTLLAVNCGAFNHDDSGGTITDDEYKTNWRSMLNASKADLFAMSDCPKTFGNIAEDSPIVLFGNTIRSFDNNNTYNYGLALASRIQAEYVEQIDVGGESAWRKLVNKYKVSLNGKEIMVYVGHYQPEAGREAVRSAQYANVISDAQENMYQYVVFCGDFNAQTISEYDPFVLAGYVICNGGYTGEYDTLRNIPADNIIYSPNIMEKSFEIMEGYTLNTDHKAIVATLMLKD